jgi:hypothetical protein
MQFGEGGTLTIKGIAWSYFKYEGKLAFGNGNHAIIQYDDCFYNLVERGRILFTGMSVVECLEVAHEYVWDYHADHLKPSWLCQEAPIQRAA